MRLPSQKPIKSTFLSCEKDFETLIQRLFIESRPHSDVLKALLIINTKDCLDNMDNPIYKDKINSMSLKDMRDQKYITFEPLVKMYEHEEVRSYLYIDFDNFVETSNPEFRDNTVTFHIICHTDCWDLGDFRLRPLKIAGYIDGILNHARLSGIGWLNFIGCKRIVLDENLSGYSLVYSAVHGGDDSIPDDDDEQSSVNVRNRPALH